MAAALGAVVDPDGVHAERLGRFQVVRHVFDEQRARRVEPVRGAQARIGARVGLGMVVHRADVVDRVELVEDAEPAEHPLGIGTVAVGEHKLAAGKARQRAGQRLVWRQNGHIDIVHEREEIPRLHAMAQHQPAQRGSMLVEIAFLDGARLGSAEVEQPGDEGFHAHVDLREEVGGGRVERVVHVEDPGLDRAGVRGSRATSRATSRGISPGCAALGRIGKIRIGMVRIGTVRIGVGHGAAIGGARPEASAGARRPRTRSRRPCAGGLALALLIAGCGGAGPGAGPGPGPQAIAPPPPPLPAPQPPATFDTPEYRRSDGAVAANVLPAWSEGASGAGVIVATIDSGIASQSPEFAGRIHPASRDVTGNGRPIADEGGHGTSVAGVLAAARNGQGIVGIAPEASLAVFRADRPGSCGSSDGCRYSDFALAQGIDSAIAAGARVINMSLGGSAAGPVLQAAFGRAGQAGVVLVISAGNDGAASVDGLALSALQAGNPASVLVAGSMGPNRTLSEFSNRAGAAAAQYLVALGERVRSFNQAGEAFLYSGTSYAAPQLSGAIALLAQAFPQLSAQQLVQILLRSADEAGAPGPDPVWGSGILNIGRAFQPIGQTSLAATSLPIATSPGGNGQMGMAMGDGAAFGAALARVPVADGFGRLFALDVAATLRTAYPGRLAARLPGLRRAPGETVELAAGPLALAATLRAAPAAAAGADPFRFALGGESHLGLAQRGLDARPAGLGETLAGTLRLGPMRLSAVSGPGARLAGAAAGELPFLVAPDALAPPADLAARAARAARAEVALGAVFAGVVAEAGAAPHMPGRSLAAIREDRVALFARGTAGPFRLGAELADVRTEGGFLGTRLAPALGLIGSHGQELGAEAGLDLAGLDPAGLNLAGIELRVAALAGWHTPVLSGSGLLAAGGRSVATSAWSVAGAAPLGEGRVRFAIAQPVAVTGGALLRRDFVGGTAPRPVPLSPPARERALEIGWDGPAGGIGQLSLGAFHRAHAGHHHGVADSGAFLLLARRW